MSSSKIKLFYDHQIFSAQKMGGISRYYAELIKRAKTNSEISLVFPDYISENIYLDQTRMPFFIPNKMPGRNRLMKELNKITSIQCLKQELPEIIHPTYYDPYVLKYRKKSKIVTTVYDMIHEKFPDQLKSEKKVSLNKQKMVEHSDVVIAISESTKKDLIEIFNVPASKIQVTHLASSLPDPVHFSKELESTPFVLFVGRRGGYKNFDSFIKAFSRLPKSHALSVLCVGGGEFSDEEIFLFKSLGLETKMHQTNLTDAELAMAYIKTKFFVFPSVYEGFGIPALEAMALGCPTLLYEGSSLQEIGGPAALFFKTENELIQRMESVLSPHFDQKRYQEQAMLHAKKFSWDTTFNETLKIYREVSKTGPLES